MKIPWGSSSLIRMRLVIVAVVIFVLAVLFWPNHTVYVFSVEPGQEATVTFAGNDFEYDLFVHSVDAFAGTAELSIFIPAYSAYSVPGGSYEISLEQNWAVTLSDFKEGQIYEFKNGDTSTPLFKVERVDDIQVEFSVLDSWLSDNPETQDMQFSLSYVDQGTSVSVITDKAKYSQGETVNISITNDTDSDIEMCYALFRIGQLNCSGGRIEWRQLMLGNSGYSANEMFVLHAGESIGVPWDQMEQIWGGDTSITYAIKVEPGQYKVEAVPATGNYSYGVVGYNYRCYSVLPEFPLDKSDYSVIIEIE